MVKLFTYGTLMQHQVRHELLQNSTFLGPARTSKDYDLYSLGSFPGLVPGGFDSIEGELYLIDDKVLNLLDMIEGHPSLFKREEITLENGEAAIAYLFPRARVEELGFTEPIYSGSWRKWLER